MLVTTHMRKEPRVCRISVNNLRIFYETRMVFVNARYDTHTNYLTVIFIFCFVYSTIQRALLQGHTRCFPFYWPTGFLGLYCLGIIAAP